MDSAEKLVQFCRIICGNVAHCSSKGMAEGGQPRRLESGAQPQEDGAVSKIIKPRGTYRVCEGLGNQNWPSYKARPNV